MNAISDLAYILGLVLYFVFALAVVMVALALVFEEERWWLRWLRESLRRR